MVRSLLRFSTDWLQPSPEREPLMAAATDGSRPCSDSAPAQTVGRLETGGVMRKSWFCRNSWFSIATVLALLFAVGWLAAPAAQAMRLGHPGTDVSSSPADQRAPTRPATPDEAMPRARILAPIANGTALRDVIVSNTNPARASGGGGGSEPRVAVNPADPDEIVISSFFGGWGT